jgi:hypothetical protein
MTTRRRYGTGFVLSGTLLLTAAALPAAADPCLGDATQQFVECKAGCKETLQAAKDGCLNRDHECVEICRAVREECRLATGLDAALLVCRNDLRAAKDACRASHPEDSPELDACIDAAQVDGYECRRAARVAARPALGLCRTAFRDCAKACPPPDDPSEVVDPVQCKLDAKADAKLCKAACREERQVQRDLCLDRDHVCVEGCRSGRDACRQPVEDTREAAIASCNATRDTTVAGCAEGDSACVEAAFVAAFQCRDAAREAARPNLEACGDGFQACAGSCPPAS